MAILEIDRQVFLWINGLAGHVPVIDNIVSAVANDYFVIVVGCMVMVALWTGTRGSENRRHIQKGIMVAAVSLGTSQGMVQLINHAWSRTRPFIDLEATVIFYRPTDPSFPSNSASVLFGMAWGIFLYNRKAGSILLALSFLQGLSRIYVGVHYPLDILAGAAVGLMVALFFMSVFKLLDPLVNRAVDILRHFSLA
jgi:undecaprenyl-diphosphatase